MIASASNRPESQQAKRHSILQLLRRSGAASRFSLSKSLGISNARICTLVEGMLEEGLVNEEITGKDRRGRNGAPVSLNSEFGQLLGFDMEAKRMRLVVEDFAGQTLEEFRQQVDATGNRQEATSQILNF